MQNAVTATCRAVAILVVVAALAACGDSSPSDRYSSPSTTTTTTTTTTVPTTTAPPLPTEPQGSPQEAATALVQAWRDGDRDAALAVALAPAVDDLFSAGEPGTVQNRGCQSEVQPKPQCVYATGPGELQIRTAMQGDGWIVDYAHVSAA